MTTYNLPPAALKIRQRIDALTRERSTAEPERAEKIDAEVATLKAELTQLLPDGATPLPPGPE